METGARGKGKRDVGLRIYQPRCVPGALVRECHCRGSHECPHLWLCFRLLCQGLGDRVVVLSEVFCFRVWGSEFGVEVSVSRVWGLEFGV